MMREGNVESKKDWEEVIENSRQYVFEEDGTNGGEVMALLVR